MKHDAVDLKELERLFNLEMEALYNEIYEQTRQRAPRFREMVARDGGLATTKTLLQRDIGNRLADLWECDRLDLSMEARILQPRWRPLFTEDELGNARDHLRKYRYLPVLEGRL